MYIMCVTLRLLARLEYTLIDPPETFFITPRGGWEAEPEGISLVV